MEELPIEDDIDLEALQAQIDLSLAHTKELVSSWIKPSASSSKTRKNVDKEIEEILRRPPRLGVGAPIPASTGSLGHESVKLKNKLTGKKRSREDEGKHDGPVSEDEEESRAGAIKKKTKLDPFAPREKKKKAKAVSAPKPDAASIESAPSKSPPSAPASTQLSLESVALPVKASCQVAEVSSLTPAPEKKKKKKKKKKLPSSAEDRADIHDPDGETIVVSALEQQSKHHGDVNEAPASQPGAKGDRTNHSPNEQIDTSITRSPEKSKSSIPLLNLQGPPPEISPDVTSPNKKKRKRRKKNKKSRVVDTHAGDESEGNEEEGDDI